MENKDFAKTLETVKGVFSDRVDRFYCQRESAFDRMILLVETDDGQTWLGFYRGEDKNDLLMQCNNQGEDDDVIRIHISRIETLRQVRIEELVFKVNAFRLMIEKKMDQMEQDLGEIREACDAVP